MDAGLASIVFLAFGLLLVYFVTYLAVNAATKDAIREHLVHLAALAHDEPGGPVLVVHDVGVAPAHRVEIYWGKVKLSHDPTPLFRAPVLSPLNPARIRGGERMPFTSLSDLDGALVSVAWSDSFDGYDPSVRVVLPVALVEANDLARPS